MKSTPLTVLAVLALGALVACGTPGAPQPPSLELPRSVQDLKASRKGSEVTLSWTTPRETTERRRIRHLGETRVCRAIDVIAPAECIQIAGALQPSQTPLAAPESFTDTLGSQIVQQHPTGFATYSVEVRNDLGRSAGLSNQVTVPLAPTLPPPTDVRAQVTGNGVELTWTSEISGQHPTLKFFYRVYRRQKGEQTEIVIGEAKPLVPGPASLLDHDAGWEKTYAYHVTPVTMEPVQGRDEQVEGNDSPEIEVFLHDVFPPATPTGLQAISSGTAQQPFIDLSWAPNTEPDLAGYNVYRQEGASKQKINSELVKTPIFRDTNVQPGQRYSYSVTAVDVRGNESGRSAEAAEAVPE
jgi:hypothetical protein